MVARIGRQGWTVALVVVVVLVVAVAVGLLLRALGSAQAGAADDGSTSSVPTTAPSQEPGPTEVQLVDDASAHPRALAVRAVLQNYFDAINAGDYRLWTSAVTREEARALSAGAWQRQYRSTLDGSIVVHRLEARPDGFVALLSFTSVQDPADAPPDTPAHCLRWRASYPLTTESGELRVSPTPLATTPHTPC